MGGILHTILYNLVQFWLGVTFFFFCGGRRVVQEFSDKKKNLPNVLIAFIIMVNFLQIAFTYTSSLIAKIMPLSEGFPAKKDIILFGYRISFAFHI